MNTSKLKAILITACYCVAALCSEIKSMDTASDLQEKTSYKATQNRNEGCLDSLKSQIDSNSSNAQLLLNEDENKDPKTTSWVSYMTSPVKAVIQGTYNIVDFTVKHPTQAIITSLLIATQLTTVSAEYNFIRYDNGCNCILWNGFSNQKMLYTFGMFPNATACMNLVADGNTQYYYYGCY